MHEGTTLARLNVAVLMGGISRERDISLSTGRQIVAALNSAKYRAFALDSVTLAGGAKSLPPTGDARLTGATASQGSELVPLSLGTLADADAPGRPDVVFLALHGRGGEDGTIQGLLDLLGIPYTGSGVLASALAMDKAMTKVVLGAAGIPTPGQIVVERRCAPSAAELDARVRATFGYPVIVKPNAEGSTIGCSRVKESSELAAALEDALACDTRVLVEEYVTGVEITAGVLGNEEPEVLPLVEIVTPDGFYDYRAKYDTGGSKHIIPARISETAAARARDYALRSHTLLGCRGMSRTDFIVRDDVPVVLEVNTIPGMTPTSLLPDAARAAGISFEALLDRLIASALEGRG
jgi:D-alanine-D-alanine ligase